MVSVDTSDLEASVKDGLVEFIESKLAVKSEKDGEVVTFEDKSPRTHVTSPEIRTYLKRYIHSKELRKQYRVLSEGGSLKFVRQKVEEEEEEKEKK
jgi:uncharacterized protein YuzE